MGSKGALGHPKVNPMSNPKAGDLCEAGSKAGHEHQMLTAVSLHRLCVISCSCF